jgi:hypothetical protein
MILTGPLGQGQISTTYTVPATDASSGLFFRDGVPTDLPSPGNWQATFVFDNGGGINIAMPPQPFVVVPRT